MKHKIGGRGGEKECIMGDIPSIIWRENGHSNYLLENTQTNVLTTEWKISKSTSPTMY